MAKVHVAKQPPKPRVIISRFKAADGTVVTLARFAGAVRYRLHSGSVDPGSAALSVVHAGPRIGSGERRQLLTAFNGGFLLSAGDGGYEQEGHVISPLRRGRASLVIDRSGTARIGAWGSALARLNEAVFSVRQNLQLLVKQGHAARAAADWTAWGATLGGGECVARSAARRERGWRHLRCRHVDYPSGPGGCARSLRRAHCRGTRHQSRMDPAGRRPESRARPSCAIPGQVRPADQYLIGWTRDFITVLAA
jgi:hypothetical protein